MPEQFTNGVNIKRIENLSIVSLKVSRNSLDDARGKLQLASPLGASGSDPQSLWLGPDRWLLVSNSTPADDIVRSCSNALGEILHNAVDYSAALDLLRISGSDAGGLLATGSGVDFRPDKFRMGSCCRTRLAQVAAVIVATAEEQFDVYVDRSYGRYLANWLADTSNIDITKFG